MSQSLSFNITYHSDDNKLSSADSPDQTWSLYIYMTPSMPYYQLGQLYKRMDSSITLVQIPPFSLFFGLQIVMDAAPCSCASSHRPNGTCTLSQGQRLQQGPQYPFRPVLQLTGPASTLLLVSGRFHPVKRLVHCDGVFFRHQHWRTFRCCSNSTRMNS